LLADRFRVGIKSVISYIVDLVVGSPYDGPDGTGAVYIYHGSPDGIRPEPSQVCLAADIDPRLTTFGYSVSAGVDMDNNGYPGW